MYYTKEELEFKFCREIDIDLSKFKEQFNLLKEIGWFFDGDLFVVVKKIDDVAIVSNDDDYERGYEIVENPNLDEGKIIYYYEKVIVVDVKNKDVILKELNKFKRYLRSKDKYFSFYKYKDKINYVDDGIIIKLIEDFKKELEEEEKRKEEEKENKLKEYEEKSIFDLDDDNRCYGNVIEWKKGLYDKFVIKLPDNINRFLYLGELKEILNTNEPLKLFNKLCEYLKVFNISYKNNSFSVVNKPRNAKIDGVRVAKGMIPSLLYKLFFKNYTIEDIKKIGKLSEIKYKFLCLNEIRVMDISFPIKVDIIDNNTFEIEIENYKIKLNWEWIKDKFFYGFALKKEKEIEVKDFFKIMFEFGNIKKEDVFKIINKYKLISNL